MNNDYASNTKTSKKKMKSQTMNSSFSNRFKVHFNAFLQDEDLGQLCNDPRARKAVLAEMDDVGREAQVIY